MHCKPIHQECVNEETLSDDMTAVFAFVERVLAIEERVHNGHACSFRAVRDRIEPILMPKGRNPRLNRRLRIYGYRYLNWYAKQRAGLLSRWAVRARLRAVERAS